MAGDPNRLERVIRSARDVALIVWLTVGTVLMVILLAGAAQFVDRIGDVTPDPVLTECPDGEAYC